MLPARLGPKTLTTESLQELGMTVHSDLTVKTVHNDIFSLRPPMSKDDWPSGSMASSSVFLQVRARRADDAHPTADVD